MKTANYNDNYGYKLSKVVFTGEVGTRTDSPALPRTDGQITLSKFAATSNGAPTVDLYFSGNIRINYTYDIDNHSYGDVYINSINPSTFDCSSNNYNLNKQLNIDYSTYYDFDSGYEYSSMWIRATINWGKDGNGNLIYNGSANSSGTLTLAVPSSYVSDIIPTITIWMQLYSKQSSGPGPDPGGDYYEVTSDQEYWPYHMGTEVQQTSSGWETKGEITIPVGRYPIYTTTSDGWVIFIYDGHYCKIP